MADILEESRNPATEAYRAAYIANSSNSTPNSNSNPSKKGKNKKKAYFILGSYNLAVEEEEESDSSSNSTILDFKKSGFFLNIKGSSKPILHANFSFPLGLTSYNTTKSIELQRNKIVVEIPFNSIRKEDYRPIIEDAIVSEAIEPNKRYKLRNSPAKGTTLEVLKTFIVKFIEDNTVLSQPTDNTALEGELVDLDLDLEGAVSPDPSNLNTKKPISIEIGPSKLEPYESSSNSKLDEPSPDKPINPVIPITNEPLNNNDLILKGDKMQLDYYKLLAKTSSYILSFVYKVRKRVISKDSTPTTYKQVLKQPRDKQSKWLEAITKEFLQLLELKVFKFLPRSPLPSNHKLITCRNVLKVKKDAKNRPIKYKSRLVARGFMQVEGLDYTITYASTRAFLNSALKEEIYMEIPKGLLDLAASNKAIYKLLLKYGYNPSTPNIIKLSKALYSLKQSPREWQDKLEILLKSLGYLPLISDPGVYAIEDLGPAAYFLGWLSRSLNGPTKLHLNAAKNLFKYLNSTKDYSICFSYNRNTVADLGPKLNRSSNTTIKLSRDLYSKEGPRPLTTTSTTIVNSRNGKGSSRTSIINSSLVPIGFSDSDFTGDKATSKSTYGYLYKLAGRPISWKTKRATTIALSTPEAETDGLIEAIREV
ncbi:hypothetical protein P8C59_006522 [Phyllachora maydis]|uniref:Reverse transcriptase Ty1/copia-type domain-containing protein n=1 Tax=Phyllachora maydis TaxID=1825666 RepID=A0AAD9MEL8_9PEZI|nr:hypothetical protein P8C59_006522 [Phyllachora maydis]